jgi:hypothetical protein
MQIKYIIIPNGESGTALKRKLPREVAHAMSNALLVICLKIRASVIHNYCTKVDRTIGVNPEGCCVTTRPDFEMGVTKGVWGS